MKHKIFNKITFVYFFLFLIYISQDFLFNNNFFCNNYLNPLSFSFENPKTSAMLGIIGLYDYIMFFLSVIFIMTMFFLYLSYKTAFYSTQVDFKKSDSTEKSELMRYIKSYVVNKYNLKSSHHPLLEFVWTVSPALVLACIAYPSFILLYSIDSCIDPLYTISVIGNQWYWTYEYNDFDVETYLFNAIELSEAHSIADSNLNLLFNFFGEKYVSFNLINNVFNLNDLDKKVILSCNMLAENMLPLGYPRLLSTDQVLVLPSKTPLRLLITSNDVLHSWAIPSFGVKMDAVPGRLNQVYFYTEFTGTSWGQCSELCGVNHGFMPIEVRILPLEEFLYFVYLKLNSIVRESFLTILKIKLETQYILISNIKNSSLEDFDIESLVALKLNFKSNTLDN